VPLRPVLLILTAGLLSGCYRYGPVEANGLRPGLGVRARITGAAADRLSSLLGDAPRVLVGNVISQSGDTVIVETPAVMQAQVGSSIQTLHQRVALVRGDVVEWETRSLDRVRTFGLVGAIAAVLGYVLVDKLQGEPGSEPLPGPGGTDQRVPVFHRRP
jgi:hypothetical protein